MSLKFTTKIVQLTREFTPELSENQKSKSYGAGEAIGSIFCFSQTIIMHNSRSNTATIIIWYYIYHRDDSIKLGPFLDFFPSRKQGSREKMG